MNLGLTDWFRGGEGLKVEELEIKGIRDWVVRGNRWREDESLGTP